MHDVSHPADGSERQEFRRDGKIVYVRDELTNGTEYEYSRDGELIPSDAAPLNPPLKYTHPAPGLNGLISRILATALDPKERKFLETEALNLGCDVPDLIAEKISLAILDQFRLTIRRPKKDSE